MGQAGTKVKTVFIDGEAGTTGLQIRERLAAVDGLTVKSIAHDKRKDAAARRDMMGDADLVVLCLPDAAAREAVEICDELGADAPRIVDASSAHRVHADWVYGFAELAPGQREEIAAAARVSNPGCYPTGGIALLRPLVDAGFIGSDYPVTVNAVSGYSGGGRSMIEAFERGEDGPFKLYGLGLAHKHLPELERYSGLTRRPIFVPSVGNFAQGMLVSIPLHLNTLAGAPTSAELGNVLRDYYGESAWVTVASADEAEAAQGSLVADVLCGTDQMELFVFGNDTFGHAVLVARLDNLGKGAAGAAVQNIKLMLGLA